MAKYKIGDKVKILDGSNIEDYTGSWAMKDCVGMVAIISAIINDYINRTAYMLKDMAYSFDERGLELVETRNTYMPDIVCYTYNATTAVTTIEWSDGTKTTARAEDPSTANGYTGFVTAYAKKAAGNNNTINKLYDEWAVKKPAREMKAQIKANAAALEEQRITKKRKAKKEKWLICKRAAEIAKEYEARKIANEKYGVPIDYKVGDNN